MTNKGADWKYGFIIGQFEEKMSGESKLLLLKFTQRKVNSLNYTQRPHLLSRCGLKNLGSS